MLRVKCWTLGNMPASNWAACRQAALQVSCGMVASSRAEWTAAWTAGTLAAEADHTLPFVSQGLLSEASLHVNCYRKLFVKCCRTSFDHCLSGLKSGMVQRPNIGYFLYLLHLSIEKLVGRYPRREALQLVHKPRRLWTALTATSRITPTSMTTQLPKRERTCFPSCHVTKVCNVKGAYQTSQATDVPE